MEHWNIGKKIRVSALWFAVAVCAANAQQSFTRTWSTYIGDNYAEDGVCAAVSDTQTNLFIGGYLGQGSILNNSDLYCLNLYSGAKEGFVAKLASDGSLLWYLCLGNEKNDSVMGLAAHTNGTLFAAGFTEQTAIDNTGTDALLASLSAEDGAVNWTTSFGNVNGTNSFTAVAVDAYGYAYAVGYTTVTNLPSPVAGYSVNGTTYGHAFKGKTDAVVMKFAPGNGSVVWSCYLGGTNSDTATSIAVAADGSVYVGGQTYSPGWVSLPSRTPSPGNSDAFVVKLNTNGVHVWSAVFGGSAADAVTALTKDPSSSVLYLGGTTASSDFLAASVRLNAQAGATDGFVLRLTDTGSTIQTNWCRFYGSNATDRITALSLQTSDHLVIGGSTDTGSWLPQAGTSLYRGGQDGFLSMVYTNGTVLWSSYVGGTNEDSVAALASTPSGLVSVGSTYSPNWMNLGFWDTWTKDSDYDSVADYALPFGYVASWSPLAGVAPSVTDDPDNLTVNEGEPASFSVAADGTAPFTYRWIRNGALLSGFNTNVYTIAYAARTNNTDTYACVIANYYGTTTSQVARLTVISNGTLTVSLAPSAAVSQGAKWRIGSSSLWFASGASTNLAVGTYAVNFTNVTGWTAPAALSVHISQGVTTATSGVYTTILPTATRTVSGTNVTLVVTAPAGLSTWSLTETLPAALTATLYSSGGTWSNAAHTLTFSGVEATTTTLTYTVSCQTSGLYTVSGTVNTRPANQSVAVTGDSQILKASFVRRITGTNVVISVTQPLANVWWYTHELLPSGLEADQITGPLTDYSDGEIYWQKKGTSTNVTYVVSGTPGTYVFTDSWGQIGSNSAEPIFGDSVLIIPLPDADVPPPDILTFAPAGAGHYALTFTSVVSKTYVILTNATLGNTNAWASCVSVPGNSGTTTQQVPVGSSNLFYRVRLQP